MGAAALCAGNGDCDAVHRLDDSNNDGKVQEFGVAAVWFLAAKEDVPVSPAHVRSYVPAYSRPLTCVRVFSSSFDKISCWALSSYVTAADPGSSVPFTTIDTIT